MEGEDILRQPGGAIYHRCLYQGGWNGHLEGVNYSIGKAEDGKTAVAYTLCEIF